MFSRLLKITFSLILVILFSCNDSPTTTEDNENGEGPTISIVNPTTNSEWEDGITLTIKVKTSTNDQLAKVEFYVDEKLEFTDDTAEYEYTWNTSGKMGTHYFMVKAYDTNNKMGQSEKIKIQVVNGVPSALFIVSPSSGYTTTVFHFDASGSTDKEDIADELEVRWDWGMDGIWDTDYSNVKTADHNFTTEGTKRVLLEVKDTDGQTDTMSIAINVMELSTSATVTDIDGNVYQTVQIGNQIWMAENLKVTHYLNGEEIHSETNDSQWGLLSIGAYCSYNNDESDYGFLYNFYAVESSKGLAPEGWHVSTDEDWKALEISLGMAQDEANNEEWRGTNEDDKLKETGTSHWLSTDNNTDNSSGFTAIPGGFRSSTAGFFNGIRKIAYFWSVNVQSNTKNWMRRMDYNKAGIFRYHYDKQNGYSVRCVKD